MTKTIAFGSLLLLSSALVSPAALAQATGAAQAPEAAPASSSGDAEARPEETIEISVPGAEPANDEIVITGARGPGSLIRQTPQVISILSNEDIARTGEGDIAGALQRVTGLSVVTGGFVYVRGLGDRYSLSLLNGSPLPSPEPLRRVVPLDIFPTSIVASALVQKTYSPNFPGEFGGGVINLTTTAIPRESFVEFSGSISGDSFTTDNLGYTYYGSDTDVFGYDDGTRRTPTFIRDSGANGNSIPSEQITALSNAATTVLQRNRKIPPNFSASVNAGTTIALGDDARLGIIANLGLSNAWDTRDALQQDGDITGDILSQYRAVQTNNRAIVNGLLGLGLEFGNHRLRLTNVYIHDTVKQGRLSRGYDLFAGATPVEGEPDPVIRQGTYFFERELYDLQGVAEFDFGDLDVDLRGTYATTQRNSPYERDFVYSYDSAIGDYVNRLSGSFETATIAFSELDEQVIGAGADVSYRMPTEMPLTVTGGYAYTDTQRSSTRYFFRYRGPGGNRLSDVIGQLRPDFLLSDFTIITNGIFLQPEAASGAAAYDADLTIHAGYIQADVDLTDQLRLSGGVRYETADQSVVTNAGFVPTSLSNDYWLPALTLTWEFADSMQLRLHGSKTIARPQFRELAPQQYEDFDSDRSYFGNPLLTDSELYNAEARFEWYMGRDQRLSVSGFYKRIDNPIESVVGNPDSSGDLLIGFTNAPRANLYGGEIELQRFFPLDWVGGAFFATRRLFVIANYTYTQSRLQIASDDQVFAPIQPISPDPSNPIRNLLPAGNVFGDGDPLVGQSDHLVNFQVGIEDTDRLSQLTILFNYASERVTARGSNNYPDLVERPGLRVDVVARQGIDFGGPEAELRFEARNIFGTDYREVQDFETTRISINSYDVGTTFSLGLNLRF